MAEEEQEVFEQPPIEPLDLQTHAEPMRTKRGDDPQTVEAVEPTPAPDPQREKTLENLGLLKRPQQERAEKPESPAPPAPDPKAPALPPDPFDPSTYPARSVPPLHSMPPDVFDQKSGGKGFNLWSLFQAVRNELGILRKQLMDVWPPRSSGADDSTAMGTTVMVNLSSTSGSAGNKTTAVSFVYTISSLGGTTLATGKAPLWPSRSENGKRIAASKGLAYYDANNAIQLAIAFEADGTGSC